MKCAAGRDEGGKGEVGLGMEEKKREGHGRKRRDGRKESKYGMLFRKREREIKGENKSENVKVLIE